MVGGGGGVLVVVGQMHRYGANMNGMTRKGQWISIE